MFHLATFWPLLPSPGLAGGNKEGRVWTMDEQGNVVRVGELPEIMTDLDSAADKILAALRKWLEVDRFREAT